MGLLSLNELAGDSEMAIPGSASLSILRFDFF